MIKGVRRAALAVAVLLSGGAAHAGPFDTYQLIMWQERTPQQIEGLKRLGFTATKLRATGGQIEPAELAAHIASGLPWYLENIATDFYAPYHRYRPGRPVTWLFDQAKARHRADPADTSVFIREPSLSDPDWQARIAARLRRVVGEQARYHPLFYNLADESGIADLAAAWDFDLGAASLVGLRAWLRTQYPSLPALNQEWGTRFAQWDEVVPELTDAALQRTDGNYAAWADFKAWMDVEFAHAVRAGTDAVHGADAEALAGLEGGQVPGWGGYDYFQLAPSVDVFEIYDNGDAVAIAAAAHPGLVLLRTSFSAGDGAEAWRNLLQGGRGTVVWDEGNQVVNPDGSPAARGAELGRLVTANRAVAPAIFASRPDPDPVGVLVSQASFRIQWLLDRIPGGAAWSNRDSGREYEDEPWRAARRETLQRLHGLGIEPRLLSSAMLETGALARGDIRVLILPDAIALSDAEVSAIRAFAQAGGTVLADTEPGLFDGHGRRRAVAPLADIAPVKEAIMRRGTPPDAATLDGEADLLQAVGVVPRVVLRRPDGVRATGLDIRWRRHGTAALLSIQPVAPDAAPREITLHLPSAATVRDVRSAGPSRTARQLTLALDPAEPTILEVSAAAAGNP